MSQPHRAQANCAQANCAQANRAQSQHAQPDPAPFVLPGSVQTIGIIGAGKIGVTLAAGLIEAGYDVSVCSTRHLELLRTQVNSSAPGARAVTTAEVCAAQLVVAAIPLHRFRELPAGLLAGRVVVDVMNYWPPADGELPYLANYSGSSSELVQQHLRASTVVRTLNHLSYHQLRADRRPAGDPSRNAVAVAGDCPQARRLVASVIDRLGFTPVTAGELANAKMFDSGTPIFTQPWHSPADLAQALHNQNVA